MLNCELTIRTAKVPDAGTITRLSANTFYETFKDVNTKEDMEKYLHEKFDPEVIRNELGDEKNIFFIAELDKAAAGYSKLRDNKIPEGLKVMRAIEIERIYVYKKFQKQKIGAGLMQKNIDYAHEHGFHAIWLGVWEHNPAAIDFYQRWGFEVFGKHIFRLGEDDQNDLLMRKLL